MSTNICVLRSGGDFKPEHVLRLAKQVKNLVCLSDVDIGGIKSHSLWYDWPKWWAKIEICRPDIKGDVMFYDLDTIVINEPQNISVDTVLTDFGDSSVIGSGLMYLTEQTRNKIWAEFIKDPQKAMQAHIKWPAGDGGFILPFVKNAQRWQNVINVYSWKYHCNKGIPNDADVVCFHGKPRPWDIGL